MARGKPGMAFHMLSVHSSSLSRQLNMIQFYRYLAHLSVQLISFGCTNLYLHVHLHQYNSSLLVRIISINTTHPYQYSSSLSILIFSLGKKRLNPGYSGLAKALQTGYVWSGNSYSEGMGENTNYFQQYFSSAST